jgi:hypothetical protein
MANLLLLCAGDRDLRELSATGIAAEHSIFRHDYATDALESLVSGSDDELEVPIRDPREEVADIVTKYRGFGIDGVITTDDYPGSTLATLVARALDLPGVDPVVDLNCQHKYFSRCAQALSVPDAVPWFARIADCADCPLPPDIRYPAFVKPVKSFFSVGARRVDSTDQLRQAIRDNPASPQFLQLFGTLLEEETGLAVGPPLIVEDCLTGVQATLDGFVHRGRFRAMGIVDSIMFPGTISFARFEYPSSLERPVQQRMEEIAAKVIADIGLDNGLFNIEFMVAPTGAIRIIEINPRMSSQFADLYEKVDGYNPYRVLADLALAKPPRLSHRKGRYPLAASCVLRTFADHRVLHVPSVAAMCRVKRLYPDARVEILATPGRRLSDAMQDGHSFRYGLVNIGGNDRDHILKIFDRCRQMLPFKLMPIGRSEVGRSRPTAPGRAAVELDLRP